jgi:hypothetical protein
VLSSRPSPIGAQADEIVANAKAALIVASYCAT